MIISFAFFKGYFYFIIYWVLELLSSIEKEYFENNYTNFNKTNSNNNTNNTNSTNYTILTNSSNNNNEDEENYVKFGKEVDLLYLILLIIIDLSSGFLVAYTYFRMKYLKKNNKEIIINNAKSHYELIYNDPGRRKNKYLLILIISLLDFFARGSELFFFLIVSVIRLDLLSIIWITSIDILARIIFCHYILKIKLYKHHIISIIFCFSGFLIMAFFGMANIKTRNGWLYVFFLFTSTILFALEDTLNKILLTDKFLLPHYLMFWRGIFGFILILFLIFILSFTSEINMDYYKYLFNAESIAIEITRKIFLCILTFIKVFCIFRIIYIFTPQHVGFCNIISCFIEVIKYVIKVKGVNTNIVHFIFDMMCLILVFMGTLLFNEMIIINAFGLNENTKVGKMKKEIYEHLDFNSTIINDNQEYNDDKQINLKDINEDNNEPYSINDSKEID